MTIMKILSDGSFKVLATNGDTNLGGQDIDNALCQFFIDHFNQEEGIDLSDNSKAKAKLKSQAKIAK